MSLIIGQCLGYVQVVSVYWMYWYLYIGESLTGLLRFATLTGVRVLSGEF
jgi:hypothetical protein